MIVDGSTMIQINRDRDLPLHYEASPLEPAISIAGWPAGIVAIVAGIATYVQTLSWAGEIMAAVLVLIGCTLVVALVRCRRYEVTVGRRMIELGLGPFRRRLPTGCVMEVEERPASSWRRFFARSEVALTLSVETRPLIVPTRDPDELRTALRTSGPGTETDTDTGTETETGTDEETPPG
jgi:lysylphosphatidylglycerol synthetase-like protein (DUF2156 family)